MRQDGADEGQTHSEHGYDTNPFLPSLVVETKWRRETVDGVEQRALVNLSTGIIEGRAEIVRRVAVDREAFVKVFAAHLRVFFDLSQKGIRLLEVIMALVAKRHNEDIIYISSKVAIDYYKMNGKAFSSATYYRARLELIDKKFIAPTKYPHRYWINPTLFWNGDRVRFITELERENEVLPTRLPQRLQI